ncbi:MAG TPA: cytochrome P450 [Micromonospora sp.]|nr:cytochrome P450 [Micromonospora sp.]
MSKGRRRDRRVYLSSHPLLFALLAATRRRPVVRLGRTVVVHGRQAYLDALTRVPMDRTAAGTTGGAARGLDAAELLFDQEGAAHRSTRRSLAEHLSSAGVTRLRPVWQAVLQRRIAPLTEGEAVDLVPLAAELAGVTIAAMLDVEVDPLTLADAARDAAAAAARDHIPGLPRPGQSRAARAAADRLIGLLAGVHPPGRAAMLTVAAVNTTIAAIPRAVAWCADDGLWAGAADPTTRMALVDELLRVTAPSPLLPRVAAAAAAVGDQPVEAGDRLVLVCRHAVDAHGSGPGWTAPAPPQVAQLVFGAGPHACPGARLARAQLADVLSALAPHRPMVVRARVDRHAALPGWATLIVRAGPR